MGICEARRWVLWEEDLAPERAGELSHYRIIQWAAEFLWESLAVTAEITD
jgi:hypothetical protein